MTPGTIKSLTVDNATFNAYDKYTFSNYADFLVNGSIHVFVPGNLYYLINNTKYAYTARLNISSIEPENYTTNVLVTSLTMCYVNKTKVQAQRPPPVFVPVYLNLDINVHNYVINATSSAVNDTVYLYIDRSAVASGKGSASYNATWYPAGTYTVEGKDIDSGTFINRTFIKPLFAPQLKFIKTCANDTSEAYTCTTSAQISSHNGTLLGILYVNGKPVDSTSAMLNYTISQRGIYNITFKTKGNGIYASNSIAYTFQNGPTYDYLPSALAVVLSACAIVLLLVARRTREDEELRDIQDGNI